MTDTPAKAVRTRRRLLAAAGRLIASGATPSTTEVAEAAGVSRRTAYRYFPTQEQLLVEASLEGLRPQVEAAVQAVSVVAAEAGQDEVAWALARLDATVGIMHELGLKHEGLLRTMQRLTAGGATAPGVRPRGSRRVDWLTEAVEPVRGRLGTRRFARLVSALCSCVGFDSLFVLRDVRGLPPPEALRVTRWMAAALLRASVAEGAAGSPGSPRPASR
jgi:AcrR family transcriptional regulator